jgi:hypothetical protein
VRAGALSFSPSRQGRRRCSGLPPAGSPPALVDAYGMAKFRLTRF